MSARETVEPVLEYHHVKKARRDQKLVKCQGEGNNQDVAYVFGVSVKEEAERVRRSIVEEECGERAEKIS